MNREQVERLLKRIADTTSDEISCSDCFELLSAGVDLELAGRTDAPVWQRLSQHLDQCGVCREEYDTLRDFLREEDGPEGPR
jgi:predicted anti-sigma-YlaC factor YlaD